jgi:hypothetical protein
MDLQIEKLNDNYLFKMLDLSFQFYDYSLEKEKYEEDIDSFIQEFSSNIKSSETKFFLNFFIEFIEKNLSVDEKFLKDQLEKISKFILFRTQTKFD